MIRLLAINYNKAKAFHVMLGKLDQPIGILYQQVDGYYVYQAPQGSLGLWSAGFMRMIANELDRLNAPWDEKVKKMLTDEGLH